MRRLAPPTRAPLALAAFLALPILFASLMAVSLAIEKPRVVEWSRPGGHIARIYHDPTGSLEARIWLLAVLPPLLLVLAGWLFSFAPFGVYLSCIAAVADGFALTLRLHRWQVHHAARFPQGADLLPDASTSSSISRGEWEQDAADTVWSLLHYMLGLAIAAVLIALLLAYRRRQAAAPRKVSDTHRERLARD